MAEQSVITILNEFVDVALKNRKYTASTAYGFKGALKIFSEELSPEEQSSMEIFKERFEQIYSSLVSKKQKIFNISSLQAYRRRVLYVLRDYEKYGIDPSKMVNWNPTHHTKIQKDKPKQPTTESSAPEIESSLPGLNSVDADLTSFRPSKNVFIRYPIDYTPDEVKSIKSFADYLISRLSEDKTGEK